MSNEEAAARREICTPEADHEPLPVLAAAQVDTDRSPMPEDAEEAKLDAARAGARAERLDTTRTVEWLDDGTAFGV